MLLAHEELIFYVDVVLGFVYQFQISILDGFLGLLGPDAPIRCTSADLQFLVAYPSTLSDLNQQLWESDLCPCKK